MWYSIGTTIAKIYLCLFLLNKFVVSHTENIPVKGPVILASNHKSNFDPFCIGAVVKRQVHFMAKDELFHNPFLAWLMRKWRTVQVKRGESDRKAINAAIEVLKSGQVLGIFVEGTRRKDIKGLGDLKAGAAMLSQRINAPIVPAAIKWGGRRIHIRFGQPIFVDKLVAEGETISRKAMHERINEAITNALNALLEDSYVTQG